MADSGAKGAVSLTEKAKRIARGMVSLEKKRFAEDGFDLDLTYITPRVIAMGFPTLEGGLESNYRNPMPEVQRFFKKYHDDHFKVYNLCIERFYDLTEHFPLVEHFPFYDHNCPPFELLKLFCQNVDYFLSRDPKNVIAVRKHLSPTQLVPNPNLTHPPRCIARPGRGAREQ